MRRGWCDYLQRNFWLVLDKGNRGEKKVLHLPLREREREREVWVARFCVLLGLTFTQVSHLFLKIEYFFFLDDFIHTVEEYLRYGSIVIYNLLLSEIIFFRYSIYNQCTFREIHLLSQVSISKCVLIFKNLIQYLLGIDLIDLIYQPIPKYILAKIHYKINIPLSPQQNKKEIIRIEILFKF